MAYPKRRSIVSVEFIDGEVREFTITASPGIANYLNNELQHGALRLSDFDADTSVVIPASQIKLLSLRGVCEEDHTPNEETEQALRDSRSGNVEPHSEDDRAIALNDPIRDLDWASTRCLSVLHAHNIRTVRELLAADPARLAMTRGAGRKTIREINEMRSYLRPFFLEES